MGYASTKGTPATDLGVSYVGHGLVYKGRSLGNQRVVFDLAFAGHGAQ